MKQALLLVAALLLMSCSGDEAQAQNQNNDETMTQKLYLTIDGQTRTATLVSNSSAEALVAALQQAPITYEAHDYGNFEKVGPLGQPFPQNNTQITTQPGDLILYQGSNLCIYYDTNSWNFTRIGRIDNASQADIKQFVKAGQGNVSVTLSLDQPTDVHSVKAENVQTPTEHTLAGVAASRSTKGIIMTNGKKIIR